MKYKTIRELFTIIFMVTLLGVYPYINVRAKVTLIVKGYVKDPNGNPIQGARIFLHDYSFITEEFFIRLPNGKYYVETNENGFFEFSVEDIYARYQVYVAHVSAEGELDYVPVVLDIHMYEHVSLVELNVTLYPSASVIVNGSIVYIGGNWRGYIKCSVYDTEGRPYSEILNAGNAIITYEGGTLNVKPKLISTYDNTLWRNFEKAIEYEILPKNAIFERLVLVPANYDFLLVVYTRVVDVKRYPKPYVVDITIPIGNRESPYKLSTQSPPLIVDITPWSIKNAIKLVESDIAVTRKELDEMETYGFFIAREREELSRAEALVEEASNIPVTGENVELIIDKLERAYVIAREYLVLRMNFMRTVAIEGASLLPVFLSIFAVTLAFYFFEDNKRKMLSYPLFYLGLILVFILVYPGFHLVERTLFLESVIASLLGVLVLIFILPRHIKEPDIPGKIQRRSLIAITFSVAKRYSKTRKTRTLITVFSLAALIWAFTVLASISTVYGIRLDEILKSSKAEGILIKHLNASTGEYLWLSYYSDYRWFLLTGKISKISPRIYTRPIDVEKEWFTIENSEGRKVKLYALLGLSSNEEYFSKISTCLISGDFNKINDTYAIIIPSSISRSLGIGVGDTVKLVLSGAIPVKYELKVVGILSEDAFDDLKDIDGESLRPLIEIDNELVHVNSTDMVILNWNFMRQELEGISEIASIALSVKSDVDPISLAREYIERKGTGYIAWIALKDKCFKAYVGEYTENIFEQNIAFIVPILIVSVNVIVTMYSIVHERRREIFIFNAIGFNPTQIAMLFLAESIVYGLLGGGIGYISGLATFRVIAYLSKHPIPIPMLIGGQPLMVRPKLEWFWSIIMIAIAIMVSMISSFKPAINAAFMYSPTKVKRLKIEEKEREKREEVYLKAYTGKRVGLPGKIGEAEAILFFSFLYTRLKDLTTGYVERAKDIEELEEEEYPDGRRVKRFKFKYIFRTDEREIMTDNEIIITKLPQNDYYTVELSTNPLGGERIPIKYMDRVASVIRDIVRDWEEERKRLGIR
ncbi:MAG: hypothetical protein DRJ32_00265 [Thermoprotei archaeon]|nr:MAG: hypothetical protein DRJ32_00265 [Thermoprotei archaeon]HDD63568.1 FtsX-like permease family protein [Thermoprotei archaeon]